MEEGRTDTVPVGAVVMLTLTEMLGFPAAHVARRALREGVALREHGRAQMDRGAPASTSPLL